MKSVCHNNSLTVVQGTFIFLGVQLGFSLPQFHIFAFVHKLQTGSDVLHQDILSSGPCGQSAASIAHLRDVSQVSSEAE